MIYLPEKIQAKFNELVASLETLPRICAQIANGGSMIDMCELWGVPYGVMLEWINSDNKRHELYQRAMTAQMYWAIDRVLVELKHMGTVDIGGLYDDNGTMRQLKDIPAGLRRCIASVETNELFEGVGDAREVVGYTKKVKVFDKIKALELIGKKFAMFIDRARVDLTVKSLEDLIDETWKDKATEAETVSKPEIPPTAPPTTGFGPPPSIQGGPTLRGLQETDLNSEVVKEKLNLEDETYHGKG